MKKLIVSAIIATAALSATTASAADHWIKSGITLNARSGPSTYYDVVHKFKACSLVKVNKHDNGWSQISWNGGWVWVAAKYLQDHECGYQNNTYKPKPKPKTGYTNNY